VTVLTVSKFGSGSTALRLLRLAVMRRVDLFYRRTQRTQSLRREEHGLDSTVELMHFNDMANHIMITRC
jgi:hypothetical protein